MKDLKNSLRCVAYLGIVTLIFSCAKIPTESIVLIEEIQLEGERMHKLNKKLMEKMFEEKRKQIDEYIVEDYTPVYISNFMQHVPDTLDVKNELPEMLEVILRDINKKRFELHRSLEKIQAEMMGKLNEDYIAYKRTSEKVRELLVSAVKVNEETSALFNQLGESSGEVFDVDQLENVIDKMVLETGDNSVSDKTIKEQINVLINKK